MKLILCFTFAAAIHASDAISSKLDFGEPPPTYFNEEPSFMISNGTAAPAKAKSEGEDVDVQHTIVISTKLNNNHNIKRGFTSNGETDGTLTYNFGQAKKQHKDDSDDVPIVTSYKSVETTELKTPDTRYKTKIYPDSIFVNRNIRDEGDVYPNVAVFPLNWKPAGFYNNINYWDQNNNGMDPYSMSRRRRINQANKNRKISEEGQREFYCKKCAEMSNAQGFRGCGVQQRSANGPSFKPNIPNFKPNVPNYNIPNAGNVWYETTTQKMKIDGKLAKLN